MFKKFRDGIKKIFQTVNQENSMMGVQCIASEKCGFRFIRFNQGVVTINLADIALSSEGDYEKFWQIFEERTELCHKALKLRHERLEGTLSDIAPVLWQHGALARLDSGETIDKLLHGGYSTISLGYAGLYECVKYMTDNSHTDNDVGEKFGLEVMQPLAEENLDGVLDLVNRIRLSCPNKSIWIYTGFTLEDIWNPGIFGTDLYGKQWASHGTLQIKRQNIIKQCDVLIDGKYIDSKRDITLHWRGSSNQRVISIQESLKQNKIVLYNT